MSTSHIEAVSKKVKVQNYDKLSKEYINVTFNMIMKSALKFDLFNLSAFKTREMIYATLKFMQSSTWSAMILISAPNFIDQCNEGNNL